MGVDGVAVTSAEAAQYRAAGWWSDTTLSDCVSRNAASLAGQARLRRLLPRLAGRALTWSEFDHAATNLAHRLLRSRESPRVTRVAVWHKDTAAIHVLLVAIERCGAVSVGLGARAGVREVAQILRTARPTLVVSDVERLARPRAGRRRRRPDAVVSLALRRTCRVDTTTPDRRPTGLSPVGPDDVFLINSTSGTTGLPKCVVHTQNRWHYFHQKAVANGELTADDVFLPVIPTPFGFGIWTSHTTPIHLGATTSGSNASIPVATCAAIERHRATVLCCVSTQLAMILADPASRDHDLSSLRVVFTGGEPLPYTPGGRSSRS